MEENKELNLAWQFIENTDTNLFLTGKAGTGKTTFLRKLKETSPKRMVVVAPTGVAAINAGGVTIHSFFQLPFSPYIPGTIIKEERNKFRISKEKKNLFRSIDLLVIDEISMVRADLLDAIDSVMRRYKNREKPFGGVQLLMIGDLQQLSPVVKEEEERLLRYYYSTLYFFGSKALGQTNFVTIELKTIYRQTDSDFVGILNAIRQNNVSAALLSKLNERYIPGFKPQNSKGYIRLTTHNHIANQYNSEQLHALPGVSYSFRAEIKGNFQENAYPAEETLVLKQGAQVMFIKNDDSGEQRFYNGKIAQIQSISNKHITVICDGDSNTLNVEPMVWENARYTLNEETKEITEEIDGTFKQYPLRLAWAITIHKSQGLTFEKAVIDAGASFAHGQVYVALSRCKTLEGLVLASPLTSNAIKNDDTISQFMLMGTDRTTKVENELDRLQFEYFKKLLDELFCFNDLLRDFQLALRILDEHFYRLYPKLLEQYKNALEGINTKIMPIAETFGGQYGRIMMQTTEYSANQYLQERVHKASCYFSDTLRILLDDLLLHSRVETDNKLLRKRWDEALYVLKESYMLKSGLLSYFKEATFTTSEYLKYKAKLTLKSEAQIIATDKGKRERTKKKGVSAASLIPTDVNNPQLFNALKKWRYDKSKEQGLPPYTILQQKALLYMSNSKPRNKTELIEVPYFGRKSADKYGDEILSIIKQFI